MKILHDIHTHNILSLCCGDPNATTENYLKKAVELGHRTFGLSNHMWDESIPGASPFYQDHRFMQCQDTKALFKYLAPDGMNCLFGVEGEYYACFDKLGMTADNAAKYFDYVLVPDSHLHMRNEVLWDYPEIREMRETIRAKMEKACPFLDPNDVRVMSGISTQRVMKYIPEMTTDIEAFVVKANIDNFNRLMNNNEFAKLCKALPTSIAHPFSFCGFSEEQKRNMQNAISDDTLRDCYLKAKNLGAYVEINVSAVREAGTDLPKNSLIRHFRIAKDVGCKFTFGTDSHSLKTLEVIRYGDEIAGLVGLTKADIAEFLRDAIED